VVGREGRPSVGAGGARTAAERGNAALGKKGRRMEGSPGDDTAADGRHGEERAAAIMAAAGAVWKRNRASDRRG
jgi:hypothetical protein